MRASQALERTLASIDGRGYASYKQLHGTYDLGVARLAIDRVQVDPYAPPSLLRATMHRDATGLPHDLVDTGPKRVATGDFLTRCFQRALTRLAPDVSGTGTSGVVQINAPGQQVLARTSVLIADDRVEARFEVGLPANGRRVLGRAASRLLTETVPRVVEASLVHANLDGRALREHVALYLDQEYLRSCLADRGLVAFVGDDSVLPRRSGDSDLPMGRGAIPLRSPGSLRVRFDLPSGRTVTGMGVPEGVTVIVGGGYHGKSTMLRALERSVYPHVTGDGREWVITRPDAVAVRAEDGRAVTGVDISPFINGLPSGSDTRSFTTANASGSTSQAAGLAEALEIGTSLLLIDEDTSATNFMIRDGLMRRLVPDDREPITPFRDRVRALHDERGVSTVLVAGGSGAFFDVADHVIAFDSYTPRDVTEAAHAIADRPGGGGRSDPADPVFAKTTVRRFASSALSPRGKTKPARARGRTTIQYGPHDIDVGCLDQLVDPAQTEAIARVLDQMATMVRGPRTLAETVDEVWQRLDSEGLDALSPRPGHPGRLALPRRQEIHAALSRYRGLVVDPTASPG